MMQGGGRNQGPRMLRAPRPSISSVPGQPIVVLAPNEQKKRILRHHHGKVKAASPSPRLDAGLNTNGARTQGRKRRHGDIGMARRPSQQGVGRRQKAC